MAIFTRTNGDAAGVTNVGSGRAFANASIINVGIAAPITAYKVTFNAGFSGNLAYELGTGGAVETVLRIVSGNASVLAYQVDAGTAGAQQISILTERTGWTDTTIQNSVRSTQFGDGLGNIGAAANVWVGNCSVSSTGGLKWA